MRSNPKIVLCANSGWYLYNFRQSTIEKFVSCGYRVFACCPSDSYVSKLAKMGMEIAPVIMRRRSINPIYDMITILDFFRLYMRIKPDVILNFTPKCNIYSSIVAKVLRIPYINNISGQGYLYGKQTLSARIVRMLYGFTLSSAHTVFFQNNEDLRSFIDQKIVKPKQAIRVYGSGVSLSRFHYAPRQQDGYVKCLFLGRLLVEKGVRIYAEAARLLSEENGRLIFSISGPIDPGNPTGIQQSELMSWVSGGFIEYLGVTDQVENILSRHDVVVLPTSYAEGLPKSLLEAAAMGKIIVTTNRPGCRETVTATSGCLIDEGNSASLCRALKWIGSLSVERRVQMGRAARQLAESKFSEVENISAYLKQIQLALNSEK